MTEDNRPDWDSYFIELIKITATRSSCKKLKVGCMLVKDNRIISQGYNGHIAGCSHKSYLRDGHEVATVHAEQNAIADCAKRGVSCNNCKAYITHFPCLNCTKIMLSAGIKQIIYVNDYNNDCLVNQICEEAGCEIKKVNKTIYEIKNFENEENEENVKVEKFAYNNDLTFFNYWFF